MNIFLVFLILGVIFLGYKKISSKKTKNLKLDKFKKGNLNFAVVGHVEWINFLKVDQLPKPGVISHSEKSLEYPAGGGSIIAKKLPLGQDYCLLIHLKVHLIY